MKVKLIKDLKNVGAEGEVVCTRPEMSIISYEVKAIKNGESLTWDGGYFIGETNTPNSKESMLKSWNLFIDKLKTL